ncbi:MAG TPA: tetratricopeptide repeat protein [Sandaracinaceae bacterium LLY-WYZ-13_1]|nr:tetratricopeptide repeat protein [Sandaracinaceae bacterium LLY-WYZ-13_1]
MAALVGAMLLGAGPVAAQEASPETPPVADQAERDERARILFEAARVHFDAGRYEEALPEFEEAYELSGRAALLYNVGVTRERLGDHTGALEAFEAFLESGEEVPGMSRERLEARVEALRERVDRVERDELEPSPTEPSSEALPVGPIVLFSVAGASLISGVIFGGLTVAEDGNLSDGCAARPGGCTDDELGEIRAFRLVADVSFALSLASAGAALVWWLVGSGGSEDEAPAEVAWAPWGSPTSIGLVGIGRFGGS